MKAFVLAAGVGRRLRPLTDGLPKALVPVLGVPMLERLVACLARGGITRIALNAHHLRGQMRDWVSRMQDVKMMNEAAPAAIPELTLPELTLLEEPDLLGTGGGLASAAEFWGDDPLLVWNGDILADVDPRALLATHQASGAVATLVLQNRESTSRLLVDAKGIVCGIDSPRRKDHRILREPVGALQPLAFHGISVLAPALRRNLERPAPFDLVEALLEAVAAGGTIHGWDAGESYWGTTGSVERLARLETDLRARPELLARWTP